MTPPPGANRAMTPPPGANRAMTPPPGANRAMTPPPGANRAMTPPPAVNRAATPPPGARPASLAPTAVAPSSKLPSLSDESRENEVTTTVRPTPLPPTPSSALTAPLFGAVPDSGPTALPELPPVESERRQTQPLSSGKLAKELTSSSFLEEATATQVDAGIMTFSRAAREAREREAAPPPSREPPKPQRPTTGRRPASVPPPSSMVPTPLPPPRALPSMMPRDAAAPVEPPAWMSGRDGANNDAGAFPRLDPSAQTPLVPALALPNMPPSPVASPAWKSVLESVKYLAPLGRAIWERRRAQQSIRALLHDDQRVLDGVLRDLGRAAREEELPVSAIDDELRRVKEQEGRRATAQQQIEAAESGQKKELERWHFDQAERQADLTRREGEVKGTDEELRRKADERRVQEAVRAKLDAEMRALEKRATAFDARADRLESTPQEKGGGPSAAASARAEASQARSQASALATQREAANDAVAALDAPITALAKRLTDGRAALQQKKKELAQALAAHQKAIADLDLARQHAAAERDAADRELTQRFVTAGTILNLNRVEHPRLQPLFSRIDELKAAVNTREAAIVRLEAERHSYDRVAVQKGLITVGVVLGTLSILLIVLIVLMVR
jgi:hypothetical protein